jgi:hypothetical protein
MLSHLLFQLAPFLERLFCKFFLRHFGFQIGEEGVDLVFTRFVLLLDAPDLFRFEKIPDQPQKPKPQQRLVVEPFCLFSSETFNLFGQF